MGIYSITNMTSFVFFSIMLSIFIERVEWLIAEFTFGVTRESCKRDVFDRIACCEMSCEFAGSIEDMFVGEYFFMLCTEWTTVSVCLMRWEVTINIDDEMIWRELSRLTNFDRLHRMKDPGSWIWGVILSLPRSLPSRIKYPTLNLYIEMYSHRIP
jgi:hypothetical protein